MQCHPKCMMKKLSSVLALTIKHLGLTLSVLQSAKETDYKIVLEKLPMLQKMEFYSKSQRIFNCEQPTSVNEPSIQTFTFCLQCINYTKTCLYFVGCSIESENVSSGNRSV